MNSEVVVLTDQERLDMARKKVKAMKDFYAHLFSYLIVNAFLFFLNLITSPGIWWFYWPLLGWGIGLAFHWMSAFGINGLFGKDWEERKVREMVERDDGKQE